MNICLNNFNTGEVSPLLELRNDQEKHKASCRELVNMIPRTYGAVSRRPGTEYLGAAKHADKKCRLIPFNFSAGQALVIEAGEYYLRFWSDGARIELPEVAGEPYELASPWSEAMLPALQWTQLNDVVYFAHPLAAPHKLVRLADDNWSFGPIDYGESGNWPPFLDQNVEAITITPTLDAAANGLNWKYYVRIGSEAWTPDVVRAFHEGNTRSAYQSGTEALPGLGLYASEAPSNFGYYCWGWIDIPATRLYTFTTTANLLAKIWIDDALVASSAQAKGSGSVSLARGRHKIAIGYVKTGTAPKYWKDAALAAPSGLCWSWTGHAEEAVPLASLVAAVKSTVALESDVDVFDARHVGAFWMLAHDRVKPSISLALGSDGTSAATLQVLGSWSLITGGKWSGTLKVEKSADGGTNWEASRIYETAKAGRNVTAAGYEEREVLLRLKFTEETGGYTESTDPPPVAVLEATDPKTYSVLRITGVTDAQHAAASVINGLVEAATMWWSEGAWSEKRGWPRTVVMHEQRLFWAGSAAEPQRIWGSVLGDFENHRLGSRDDDALDLVLGSRQANGVRWIVSMNGVLCVGTEGDEWILDGGDNGAQITPTASRARMQSRNGSGAVPAVVAQDAVLYFQRNNRRVREFVYSFEKDGWVSPDLTLLAEHIAGDGFVEAAVQGQDECILWAVRGDGTLAGMTYERSQGVVAWHRHVTEGSFESVAVIHGEEGKPDEVWFAVSRSINGNTVRYIERFSPAAMVWRGDAEPSTWMVDCGKTINVAAEDPPLAEMYWETHEFAVSGFDHLEDELVDVLVAGRWWPMARTVPRTQFVVAGGAIGGIGVWPAVAGLQVDGELYEQSPNVGFSVVAGLPYTSRLKTQKINIDLADGTSMTRLARAHAVAFEMRKSEYGFRVIVDDGQRIPVRLSVSMLQRGTAMHMGPGSVSDHSGLYVFAGNRKWVKYVYPTVLRRFRHDGTKWIFETVQVDEEGTEFLTSTITTSLATDDDLPAALWPVAPIDSGQWIGTMGFYDDVVIGGTGAANAKREIILDTGVSDECMVTVEQDRPLPTTVAAIVVKLDFYGK